MEITALEMLEINTTLAELEEQKTWHAKIKEQMKIMRARGYKRPYICS